MFLLILIIISIKIVYSQNRFNFTGIVYFEAGFFGIISNNGTRYEPINLPDEFAQDGLPVKIQAEMCSNCVSVNNWGNIIKVITIDFYDINPVVPIQLQTVTFEGTIEYIMLEGGFYGIQSNDQKNYDPVNLEPQVAISGLSVQVNATICSSCVSFHMWGIIITIQNISVINDTPIQAVNQNNSNISVAVNQNNSNISVVAVAEYNTTNSEVNLSPGTGEIIYNETNAREYPIIANNGTIVFVPAGDGFYGIIDDSGQNYDPTLLPEQYKINNLRIEFQGRICIDCLSPNSFGSVLILQTIEIQSKNV